ncbi:hypothetical protein K9U39_04470 [Rhodoblastus acidophilus]|nr:hypothetical protein [Rhodoblastus acidophilus]
MTAPQGFPDAMALILNEKPAVNHKKKKTFFYNDHLTLTLNIFLYGIQ